MNTGLSAAAMELQTIGLFTFANEAVAEIDKFFGHLEHSLGGVEPDTREQGRDLVYLTAAEFSLMPAIANPPSDPVVPVREPITVDAYPAFLAINKTDCICLNFPWHTDGSERGQPVPLWDVTAFAADVSKLSTVGISPVDPPTDPSALHEAIKELESAHRASSNPRIQQIANAGLLQLQGFLWSSKLALPHLEAGEAVKAAANEFEVTMPAYA
jgi:hypothetical protein